MPLYNKKSVCIYQLLAYICPAFYNYMKDTLQFLGLLFVLVLSFLGANYILKGEIFLAAAAGVVLLVIVYFLISFFIRRKNEITKNRFSLLSITLWISFVLVNVPIFILCTHALNVEINAKPEVIRYAEEKIDQNTKLCNFYESSYNSYLHALDIQFKNLATNYLTEQVPARKAQILDKLRNKPFSLSQSVVKDFRHDNFAIYANALVSAKQIKFKSTLDSVNSRTKAVVEANRHLLLNWSRMRVNAALANIDNMFDDNLGQLIRRSAGMHESGIAYLGRDSAAIAKTRTLGLTFRPSNNSYIRSFCEVKLEDFPSLFDRYRPYWLIIPYLALSLLLLLPYFLEKQVGVYVKGKNVPEDDGGIEI